MKDFSQYKLLVKKSPPDKRDWKAKTIYPKIVLPEKTNNRVLMLAVRDQGNQGSCVAMAGSAMKEWQEVFDWNLESYLSPQFIYNNREDPSEEGMYMRDLMNILRKKGDCFESLYPYGTNKTITKETFDNALNYIIKNYAAVNSVEELKTALYLNGPCVVAVPVYNYTERMWYKRS
ncbi:MAG TPA: C1 family peptidase, partial [Methanosarcinales archaeon]|nr:C1 family peptidase [Methanosarcinales archaeon]